MAKFCDSCGKKLGFFERRIKIEVEGSTNFRCQKCHKALPTPPLKAPLQQVKESNTPLSRVTLHVQSAGSQKIGVIKVIREYSGLGLKEAKEVAEGVIDVELTLDDERITALEDRLGTLGCIALLKRQELSQEQEPSPEPHQSASGEGDHEHYSVKLTDTGHSKIAVIKEVRSITGLGLKEAKELVDQLGTIAEGLSHEEATKISQRLRSVGAQVTPRKMNRASESQ